MDRLTLRLTRLEDRCVPATLTWDGGGADDKWTTPANWVGDVAPTPNAGDVLVFPSGIARFTNTNDFPAGSRFARIDLRGPGYRIGGNDLVLTDGITAQSPTPVDPADFPQLSVGLTPDDFNFKLAGDANLGVVLNGPLTVTNFGGNGPTVTGRYTINGVVSGYYIQAEGATADLVLTGNNTNRGAVAASGGSLRIDGSIAPGGSTSAAGLRPGPASYLRGSGSAGNVGIFGTGVLAPGTAGPGTLRATSLTFTAGGTYLVDVTGSAPGAYDQMIVAGPVQISNGTLALNFGGTPPGPGARLRIIDNTGTAAVSGTFIGLPEGAIVATLDGVRYRITYAGGDGNDVELLTAPGPALFTWDGGGADAKWTTAANWAGDVALTPGAALAFPAGTARPANINDFPAGTAFDSIRVGAGDTLSGNAVALANGITGATTTPFAAAGATVNLGVTLTAAQTFASGDPAFTLTVGGPVDLNGFPLTAFGGTVNLDGPVSGAGGIVVVAGDLSLSGDNTYTGVTEVRFPAGLRVSSNNALGATGTGNDTRLDSSSQLTLVSPGGGQLVVPEAFTFATPTGSVSVTNSGPVTLSGPLTLSGSINSSTGVPSPLTITGVMSGGGSWEGGNLVIAASSVSPNYTGAIVNGRVQVDGQIPNALASGYPLTGTGTVRSATAAENGVIAPGGTAVGTLTLTGGSGLSVVEGQDVPFHNYTGFLAIDVTADGADQVRVTGPVHLGGKLLLTVAPGFVPALGTRYRIVDNDGTDAVTLVPSIGSFPREGAVVHRFGAVVLRITYRGGDGNDVELVAGPPGGRIAAGAGPGGGPQVNVFAEDGTLVRAFNAYDPAFRGGVRVAQADLTGDGVDDVVTAPGPGGGPDVRVWDGATGALLNEFLAYAADFTGGVNVAVGDVNQDGVPDIVTGTGVGGGPHVRVFSQFGAPEGEFSAYDPSFRGGVSVAVGDANGDGAADIVTGAGPGGGPHVKVFSGPTHAVVSEFLAFDPSFTGGVSVAVAEGLVVAAPLAGGGPVIRTFANGVRQGEFLAYPEAFRGGVTLAAHDVDGDAVMDVVTGTGPGGGPLVSAFDVWSGVAKRSYYAFDPAFLGGIFVG